MLSIDVELLPEPVLEFAHGGRHHDPKNGLRAFGPVSLAFGAAHPAQVRVGFVGPQEVVEQAIAWFRRTLRPIQSGKPGNNCYPDYPGFENVFRSALVLENRWAWRIPEQQLRRALEESSKQQRFNAVLKLYVRGLRELHKAGPSVIVACIPADVIAQCRTVRVAPARAAERPKQSRSSGQLALPGVDPISAVEDSLLHRDFRRALKAQAMDIGIPIQIGTENLFVDLDHNQDPATRAWNVSVALFFKASGLPWRLASSSAETCHVGISFHHMRTQRRHNVFASVAQAFATSGDGFVLRGENVPRDPGSDDRSVHLDEGQAERIATQVREQFAMRSGFDPLRVVFYKTSAFDEAEAKGIRRALAGVPRVELVHVRPAEFRLVRRGAYPPRRGTLATVGGRTHFLFTNGFYPDWGTYMGAHVPVPYEVSVLGSDDPLRNCTEILGLTKLNWNAARPFGSVPIPLLFAREVGSIMSHYAELRGSDAEPDPAYAFYM